MQNNIQEKIQKTIQTLYGVEFSPEISVAPKRELGEYCINVFPLAKTAGKAPNMLSEEIAAELAKESTIFNGTSATGGYVNFFLTDKVWGDIFKSLIQPTILPTDHPTIVVDYIGANVGKPLHIGHICTPSVGQTICNIYRHLGYNVIGDSHFGDWGGIFGKLIYVWKNEDYWTNLSQQNDINFFCEIELLNQIQGWITYQSNVKENIKNILLEKLGVTILLDMYQWFHFTYTGEYPEELDKLKDIKEKGAREEFSRLSSGDEENAELWKKFTSLSIAVTEKKLAELNVHATYNIGESFYEGLGLPRPNGENYPDLKFTMKDIVRELVIKGVATQNEDGSVGVIFPEETKMPSCVLQKKDGTGLYLTSDLAAIKYRLINGWNPTKIIYSVDVRQQLHLRQAFWIAKQAWPELTKDVEFFHAFNGFIKLKEGAMSTRHGTVIFLEALIEEGNSRTAQILEEKGRIGEKALSPANIQAITVGAIKYSYLAQDREKDVTFDWDKALNFEGNSGPYIQYAYVRAKKIVEAGSLNFPELVSESHKTQEPIQNNRTLEYSIYDKSLIQILARMDEVIENVAKSYKPHHLALYAYDVAVNFNTFYVHTPKILEESDVEMRNFRLALVQKTAETLEKSFELLGIKMPSEM